jgi:hypothetical protein
LIFLDDRKTLACGAGMTNIRYSNDHNILIDESAALKVYIRYNVNVTILW